MIQQGSSTLVTPQAILTAQSRRSQATLPQQDMGTLVCCRELGRWFPVSCQPEREVYLAARRRSAGSPTRRQPRRNYARPRMARVARHGGGCRCQECVCWTYRRRIDLACLCCRGRVTLFSERLHWRTLVESHNQKSRDFWLRTEYVRNRKDIL